MKENFEDTGVVESYLDALGPEGILTKYLAKVFVHDICI